MKIFRKFLGSKIHRATITHADLNYEGSITIPPDLMKAADILSFESVQVWNVTSGTRLETYAISGVPGSRDICINGAAAHLVRPRDVVIIARFVEIEESQCRQFEPTVVFVDEFNNMKEVRGEVPGPFRLDAKTILVSSPPLTSGMNRVGLACFADQ